MKWKFLNPWTGRRNNIRNKSYESCTHEEVNIPSNRQAHIRDENVSHFNYASNGLKSRICWKPSQRLSGIMLTHLKCVCSLLLEICRLLDGKTEARGVMEWDSNLDIDKMNPFCMFSSCCFGAAATQHTRMRWKTRNSSEIPPNSR